MSVEVLAACTVVLAVLGGAVYGIARIGWLLWRLAQRESGIERRASLVCVSTCLLAIGVLTAEGIRTAYDLLRVSPQRAEASP